MNADLISHFYFIFLLLCIWFGSRWTVISSIKLWVTFYKKKIKIYDDFFFRWINFRGKLKEVMWVKIDTKGQQCFFLCLF